MKYTNNFFVYIYVCANRQVISTKSKIKYEVTVNGIYNIY